VHPVGSYCTGMSGCRSTKHYIYYITYYTVCSAYPV